MSPRLRSLPTIAALLFTASVAHAQPTLPQLLARPVSPGAIAALVAHAGDASAQARLVAALQDPRADVRAMAAHVTFVAKATLAISSMPKALAGETDDHASAEMMRVVATFDGATQFDSLVAAAKTRGAETRAALLESMARRHPSLLVRLASDEAFDDAGFVPALVVASAQHVGERASIGRAALARGPATWASYLRAMHEQFVAVDPVVLKEALSSADERARTAAAYHVAMLAGHLHGAERTVLAAAADGAEGGTATTWERAYREIARRAMKRAARPVDWAALLGPDVPDARRDRFAEINATLLGVDRDAVQALAGPLPGAEYYVRSAGRDHPESRFQTTRTPAAALARLVPDLAALFGCGGQGRRSFAAAEVFYWPDGRPRVVRPAGARVDDTCMAVANTVFLLTVATPSQPVLPQTSDGVYLPMSDESMTCGAAPPEPVHDATPGPDRVLPRPRTRLDPEYPKALKALGIAGTVRIEAEISSRGCVRVVQTLSSLDPLLDVETLRTVLAAAFEPMTIGGRPVASRVPLAVTFRP
jgi:TonB family protein